MNTPDPNPAIESREQDRPVKLTTLPTSADVANNLMGSVVGYLKIRRNSSSISLNIASGPRTLSRWRSGCRRPGGFVRGMSNSAAESIQLLRSACWKTSPTIGNALRAP